MFRIFLKLNKLLLPLLFLILLPLLLPPLEIYSAANLVTNPIIKLDNQILETSIQKQLKLYKTFYIIFYTSLQSEAKTF